MKSIWKALLYAAIIFIVNFLFSLLGTFIFYPNGEIEIGKKIRIESQTYCPVRIVNYTSTEIDDLKFSVPSYVNTDDIISNFIISKNKIENVGRCDVAVLAISNILPSKNTQLYIPIKESQDEILIEALNNEQKKLITVPVSQNHSRLYRVIKSSFLLITITSLIYALFYCLVILQLKNHKSNIEKLCKDCDEKRSKIIEELQDDLTKVDKENNNSREQLNRYKILLMSRLRDYTKENDFWKDTIRKVMYENKKDKSSEQIFDIVTDSLKTYSTRRGSQDFDTIYLMASMLKDGELITGKDKEWK